MIEAKGPETVARSRAGAYVRQPAGFRAFLPKPLPPDPPLRMDGEMLELLSSADRHLGRLDGIAAILPNPDLFVTMYVRKEAVLSSQIEGTLASLVDVLEFEADASRRGLPQDVAEVSNYVAAINYGLARLQELPLSLRLLCEIHARLLHETRGGDKSPGEFRRSQNWVGPPGSLLADATFVPPPVYEMNQALGKLEDFIHSEMHLPILIKCGLVHCQFETIHPFLDGNGRIGRLLITFLLCHADVLARPLLYLSYYFKRHRAEYYQWLQLVREQGDWEGWLRFFLRGVGEVSAQATDTAKRIVVMQSEHRAMIQGRSRTPTPLRLLDLLYETPMISIPEAARRLQLTFEGARYTVATLGSLGLLREVTGQRKHRLFAYAPYLDLLREGTDPEPPAAA